MEMEAGQKAERGGLVRRFGPIVVIVVAALAAYWPSFGGAFVYDDLANIVDNPVIRQVWPATPWLDVGRRPLVSLTFVLNYAYGGLDVTGYHIVNFAVHACVCLALYGVVRRACGLKGMAEGSSRALAFSAALLFAVHPLGTQGVTYVVQRSESMMALFYVLTIWALARAGGSSRAWVWLGVSVVCCALGMASKAVMVTAPLAALVFDRLFVASSWRELVRSRWWYYAGLLAAASILVFWDVVEGIIQPPPEYEATVGFAYEGITPIEYLLAQGGVILHYLKLVFVPTGLRIDYAWDRPASAAQALPSVAAVGSLVIMSVWFALVKRRAWAFCALAFFLILGPTSSFVPIKHLAFEHRMYLPLACVLVLGVLGIRAVARRAGWRADAVTVAVCVALSVPLGVLTFARNAQYRDPHAFWERNVALEPDSPAAWTNLANEQRKAGDLGEALSSYRLAAGLDPGVSSRWVRVGLLASELGDQPLALSSITRAVEQIDAKVARSHPDLQRVLRREQRFVWTSFAGVLLRDGRREAARAAFERAIEIDSDEIPGAERAVAFAGLGSLYQTDRDFERAVELFREAVRNDPGNEVYATRYAACFESVSRQSP